jgi:DedD protein
VETRIKERLTGALILVAALVILVPEIFSGHHVAKPTREAPPAAPATEGPPLRTYTTEVDATKPSAVETTAAATPVTPPPVAPPPAPTAEAEPAPASAPTRAPAASSPSPAPQKPVAAARDKPADAPDASDAPAASRGQWFVQVGSFSQSDNAERYAKQLRDQGFTSIVLPPSGAKRLVRVRVGPTRTRDAAATLLERLKASGHKGAVVGS